MRSRLTTVAGRSRFAARLAGAVLLAGAGSLQAQGPWVALGPIGEIGDQGIAGRVISLAVDPRNPNHVFAGSASGGLWVSELSDAAKGGGAAGAGGSARDANWRDPKLPYWRWRYVDTGYPVLGVGAIAIHPTDPDVVYIGTGEVYGYRRTARGFDYQPTRGNYGIGILRSVDGGRTWTQSLAWSPRLQTGVQDLAIVPGPAGTAGFTVWAATSEGVYRLDTSKAAGESSAGWKLSLEVVAATSLSVHPGRPNEVVAACGDFASPGHGLYKTRDGGATWQRLVRGLPVSFQGKGVLARSPSDPDVLYASLGNSTELIFANDSVAAGATATGGSDGSTYPENTRFKCLYTPTPLLGPSTWLLRSGDGGDSWETRNAIKDSYNTQGWYVGALAVHPQDPDQLLPGYIGPNRSFDGGKTIEDLVVWKENRLLAQSVYDQANGSLIFVDFHAIRSAPGDPEVLYFACDQGVYRSADGGRTMSGSIRASTPLSSTAGYRSRSGPARAIPSPACRRTMVSASSVPRQQGDAALDDRAGLGPGGRVFGLRRPAADRLLHHPHQSHARPLAEGRLQDRRRPQEIGVQAGDRSGGRLRPVLHPRRQSLPAQLQLPRQYVVQRAAGAGAGQAGPALCGPRRGLPLRSGAGAFVGAAVERPAIDPRERLHLECRSRCHLGAHQPGARSRRQPDLRAGGRAGRRRSPGDRHRAALRPHERLPLAGRGRHLAAHHLQPAADGYPMALVFDPNAAHGSAIYLALGGYGISHLWKLETGEGKPAQWQDLDRGQLPDVWASGVVVDPADRDSRHLYVATDQGVYRSTDAGRGWQAWSEGLYPGVLSMELLLFSPDRLLRLVTHGSGIWERRLPSP